MQLLSSAKANTPQNPVGNFNLVVTLTLQSASHLTPDFVFVHFRKNHVQLVQIKTLRLDMRFGHADQEWTNAFGRIPARHQGRPPKPFVFKPSEAIRDNPHQIGP
jgi:hypothetical protein